MTAHVAIPRITADEFLPRDFPIGSELVDGVVYEMDPAFDHQELVSCLLIALRVWVEESGLGRAGFGGPVEVAAGQELTSPLLPGLVLDVDALFADLG